MIDRCEMSGCKRPVFATAFPKRIPIKLCKEHFIKKMGHLIDPNAPIIDKTTEPEGDHKVWVQDGDSPSIGYWKHTESEDFNKFIAKTRKDAIEEFIAKAKEKAHGGKGSERIFIEDLEKIKEEIKNEIY